MSGPERSRLLIIHHNSTAHRIKIFAGTTRAELIEAIKEHCGIESHTKVCFRDDEGDIVALSSAAPSGTELHLDVVPDYKGQTAQARPTPAGAPRTQAPAAAASSDWRQWLAASCSPTATVSADNKTWTTATFERAHVWGPALPASGRHYCEIEISNAFCCIALGLIPADAVEVNAESIWSHPKSDSPWWHLVSVMAFASGLQSVHGCNTAGSSNKDPLKIGLLVDMDKRVMYMFEAPECPTDGINTNKIIRLDGLPASVKVAAYHRKHGITMKFTDVTDAPARAVFDRVPVWRPGMLERTAPDADGGDEGGDEGLRVDGV